jgi:hypothetical protein
VQNSKISFTSGIRITDNFGLFQEMRKLPYVQTLKKPYTAESIKRGENILINNVKTCLAGGVVAKNKKGEFRLIPIHIKPAKDEPANINFETIAKKIKTELKGDIPLNGFLFGGKLEYQPSIDTLEKVETFYQNDLKIPYSKIVGTPLGGHESQALFIGKLNEWVFSSTTITTVIKEKLEKEFPLLFKKISIAPQDTIHFGYRK